MLNVFLSGEKASFRPVETKDFVEIGKWLNDPKNTHYMFYGQLPMNEQQIVAMIGAQVASPNNVVFVVMDKDGRAVGFAGLYDVHPTARKAEFRVFIDHEHWGKGMGTEVTELLTFYGFDRLNLHRIWLGVTSKNKGAVRAYKKAGYAVEGTLRDDIYRNSRYYDSIRMAILRDEYYANLFEGHRQRFASEAKKPASKK